MNVLKVRGVLCAFNNSGNLINYLHRKHRESNGQDIMRNDILDFSTLQTGQLSNTDSVKSLKMHMQFSVLD